MITAHAVVYQSYGEPKEVLKTQKFEIDDENLSQNQLIVKTLASPVNPSDINQIQGVYPSRPEFSTKFDQNQKLAPTGNEGLFEVLKVGSNVSNFEIGDWVIPATVNSGTWTTHQLGTDSDFIKVPNPKQSEQRGKVGLSLNQGATISVNPPTAYLMLTHYVKFGPKDWFIQNGGNSAVGKYASQIGKLLGINSISVVRDRPDFDQLAKELQDLGATHVITEEQNGSKEFGSTIKSWKNDGQIKLALNCVGGKSSTGIARKLDTNGLMLTYGGMSLKPVTIPTSLHIFKNFTSAGFWVTALLKENPELKVKTLNKIVEFYENKELLDSPSHEIKVGADDDLSELFIKGIQESKNGKQLIVF